MSVFETARADYMHSLSEDATKAFLFLSPTLMGINFKGKYICSCSSHLK